MKKIIALVLVFCFMLSFAVAEGKLKVTQKNLYIFSGKDTGRFYAKVENVGTENTYTDSGSLVMFSGDDDILLTKSYVNTLPSDIMLKPGEYVYVNEFLWDDVLKDAEIGDYKLSIKPDDRGYKINRIDCKAEFEISAKDKYDNYIYITFTNPSNKPLYDCYITAALLDDDNNILFVESDSLSNVAVHPKSTITVKLYISSDIIELWGPQKLKPTKVDAMVCYPDTKED